ncbi:diterpenoid dioxygenase [Novosphingobium pentaromativorans US6-1]|uniref:Diterpenoid dioxygenase n=1 Tax=Novosphingobium pentaromativorans US6-1 TaxID=1088721 RepID=G6E800_9SPHN|nr:diterpenoid dioxygenase [Novosphingobium pentaromativorans US6-1]
MSGIGMSEVGRRLHIDPWTLTADAALAAIADAGLTPSDIDGLSTYPGATWSTPGITGAGVDDVRALLGIKTRWHNGGGEMPGQLGSIIAAILAVNAGIVNHVLCFRTVWESTAQDRIGSRSATMAQVSERESHQWSKAYGVGYPTYGALWMQRYMHESGATREQLAQIALTCRAHAALNPQAVYRSPLTMDDYLSAKMISDPICLFDCDVPVDGSVAFVISRADSQPSGSRGIGFAAFGSAGGMENCAEMMWSRTSLTPADVQMAELYDGFSIISILWLEALGLCEPLGAARFIEGGERIALTGELPFNTGGGQLSGGRLHGYGNMYQACLQLSGGAGERQIRNKPEVAVVSSGVGTFASSLLLTAGR